MRSRSAAARTFHASILIAAFALLALSIAGAVAAHAQTAHFSGAVATLGSGFYGPNGVAVDSNGNVFVTDSHNNAVNEILAVNGSIPLVNPTIITLGSGFNQPVGIAVDGSGNVFVADTINNAVKEILAVGGYTAVNTLGSGFNRPTGVAVDASGNVFVADTSNYALKEIPAAGGYTTVNTLAKGFPGPVGVAVDSSGDIFLADVELSQVFEFVAGTGFDNPRIVGGGNFYNPDGVAVDGNGNVYVGDTSNGRVKEIPTSCMAGANNFTCVLTLSSYLADPEGVAVDGSGHVFFAESGKGALREILPSANFGSLNVGSTSANPIALVFTFDTAGTLGSTAVLTQGAPNLDFTDAGSYPRCSAGYAYSAGDTCTVNVTFKPKHPGPRYGAAEIFDGSGKLLATAYVQGTGVAPQATFATLDTTGAYQPSATRSLGSGFHDAFGVAVDAAGNVFVGDTGNREVKEIVAAGGYTTVNTIGSGFTSPYGIAVDGSGNIFVFDQNSSNVTVKEIVAAGGYTTVNTISSGFSGPLGLAVDGGGNVFVADTTNSEVKEIVAAGGYTTIKTLGSGFNRPWDVAVDGSGNVFVADTYNSAVKEIPASCIAGANDSTCVLSLGGEFSNPQALALDGSGNVFVADSFPNTVMEILAAGGYTTVLTLGSGFAPLYGVTVDGSGDVIVAEDNSGNPAIPDGVVMLDYADPPSLSFATTPVGQTSSDSPQTVAVANDGNAPLILRLPTTGDNPSVSANFAWDSASTCTQTTSGSPEPFELAGGAGCTMAFDFKPTLVGAISGGAVLTDNNLNQTGAMQTIQLSGTSTGIKAILTSPSPGTTLPGASATFTWTAGGGVSKYEFRLGTTGPGSKDVYNAADVTTTSLSSPLITNIPAYGVTLYARLYSFINGVAQYNDYTYTESGSPVPAALTSPTPGSTLGTSATFGWTAGGGISKYEFRLGTTGVGSKDIYNASDKTTTALSTGVISVPAYGVTVYARIYFYTYAGASQYNDYTYTESGAPVLAVLTSPAPGSRLTGSSATFNWTAGGGVTKYEFRLGSTGPGSSDVYNAAEASTTALTTGVVSNIPLNGATLYARLYSYINGAYQHIDYTYTETLPPAPAVLTSPTPGSTLPGTSATFTWTPGGSVSYYEFRLGTTGAGSKDVYNAADVTTTALTTGVIPVPAYGVTLYARLYSTINGVTQYNDYTYMESGTPVKAVLTSPTPGTTLTGSSATFSWTAGGGVTKYEFRLGTTGPGSNNVYNAADASTTALTTGSVSVPTTGATLYARLYSYINGAWQYTDYTYTEQ